VCEDGFDVFRLVEVAELCESFKACDGGVDGALGFAVFSELPSVVNDALEGAFW